jgi:P27 family predicted phage terminase small subunit
LEDRSGDLVSALDSRYPPRMGTRGPVPNPHRLRLLAGETTNAPVPIVGGGVLTPPDDLRPEARVVWERVVSTLGPTGVLTAADFDALRLYSEAFVRYQEAEAMLAKTGPLIEGRDGNFVKNPLHQIVRDNAASVKAYARELGLTPAARIGLRSEIGEQANSATAKLDAIIRATRRP